MPNVKQETLQKVETLEKKFNSLDAWLKNFLQNQFKGLTESMDTSNKQMQGLYMGLQQDKNASSLAVENEIRYGYKQNQNIYEGLTSFLKNDLAAKISSMEEKVSSLENVAEILEKVNQLKEGYDQLQALCETTTSTVVPQIEAMANKEEVKGIVEDTVSVHSQQVLEAVAAIPDGIDYTRITEEVGDKLLAILNELKVSDEEIAEQEELEEEEMEETLSVEIDYERIAGDTAAKVMESLPYPEQVDYNHVDESIATAIAEAINVDAIAEAVAAKLVAPAVDYDQLADIVVEKLAARGISADVILDEEGITKIADTVAEKVAVEPQNIPDPIDYDKVAEIVETKLSQSCDVIEKVVTLDDEGIEKIVDGVATELRNMTLVCECVEEEGEETVEEVAEEPVVEEVAEEPVVEEVEEVAEEPVAEEELAVAEAPVYEEDELGQLVDAETGLVVRLKRSFTAKMKQSSEQVKVYYSDIKNALTSYKKINSNVSWHGDRFNYGRDTVAKIGINGKTLCFYLALDPNDPELKQTVYHQKDVGSQKAYENTPFMVKVKSEAAAKKALRLVGILAGKLGAEEDESFQEVDYVAEYAYASTKSLFEEGDIKATKEKKVDFNF